MIEQMLPEYVCVAEAFSDRSDVELYPEEAAAIAQAVEKRRREFTTVRGCARDALRALGVQSAPILSGLQGEPLWPAGVVGSMTHCPGYRAAVVARDSDSISLGIDAEIDRPLPPRLIDRIALPEEREQLVRLNACDVSVDRLLFCIKETVYKAWFPITRRFLDYKEASVMLQRHGTFTAELRLDTPQAADSWATDWPAAISGRWLAANGLLLSATAV